MVTFCPSKHFSVAQECSLLHSPTLALNSLVLSVPLLLLGWIRPPAGGCHTLTMQCRIWVVCISPWSLSGKIHISTYEQFPLLTT